MNGLLHKKINKFKEIYTEEGLMGAISHGIHFLIAKTGYFRDHWILGRFIEITGNIGHLDGCRFRLDSPLIQTTAKSSFIQGTYEREERKAIRRFLNPSLPVIELGASLGVVSCITNKKLTNPENHVVVEANPQLIPILTANRDLNNCSFKIINKAVGYGAKEITFYIDETKFLSGSIERKIGKPISVPTITLTELFEEYTFDLANLICDIEGAEADLITHEIKLLSKKIFQIIIEVHPSRLGEEVVRQLRTQLEDSGFRKIRTGIYSNVLVFENKNIEVPIRQVVQPGLL